MAYVYRHIRVDKNEPFYIGIGKTPYRHIAKQGRNPIWKKIANKTEYKVEVLFENISWLEATKKEIEFISLYGRIDKGTGSLANMTDEGDGNLGLIHSQEALAKISEASKGRASYWKGKKLSPERIKKISDSKIGNKNTLGKNISEAHKQAVSRHAKGNKYCLGRVLSQETKDKISAANTGKKVKEPWKCGLLGEKNGMYGKKHSAETKKKNSDTQIKKPVIQKHLNGVIIAEFASLSEAQRITGYFFTGISACCRRYKNIKTYKGFIWEYKAA